MKIVTLLCAFCVLMLTAMTPARADDAFTLPALPYDYEALSPVIGGETMQTHHAKHHQAYVDNLNKAVVAAPALQGQTLEAILGSVSQYGTAVRNNAGGHWNHSFFWPLMAPEGQRGEISGDLKAALEEAFGSVEAFQMAFDKAGAGLFGSGWVWLVLTEAGELVITSTPNQDNPLMDDVDVRGMPILGNDVWEHAYYLDYQNRRADYLSSWWDVVNWGQASAHYEAAVAGR